MEGKRGSAGEWTLVIFMILVIGAMVLFISSKIFYTKSQVEDLVNNSVDKASCEYLHFYDDSYFGRTPAQICQEMGKEPEFLFIKEFNEVTSPDGINIYDDQNYRVETLLFNDPLGPAENYEDTFGSPSGYKSEVNRFTTGVLCCG